MGSIIKNITDIDNIYTYFEFEGNDGWDDFDTLLSILTDKMKCIILNRLDGIYSKHCLLKKNNLIFKLMYHEDFGNCLCSQEKRDEDYYNQLEKIARDVILRLEH